MTCYGDSFIRVNQHDVFSEFTGAQANPMCREALGKAKEFLMELAKI
jgi:hypothetical protein